MSRERLAVVVLTHGAGARHVPLVESLLAQGVPASALFVVHNPGEPGEAAPSAPGGCEVLQAGRNLGYTGGMNIGIARARQLDVDHVLILTHDARLLGDALDTLLAAAARQPGYGVLAPALVLTGTEEPFSFGGVTRPNGTTAHLKDGPRAVDDGIADCDWVDGGTMLIRAEAFEKVGDFDERFWTYCEEADLCLRVKRAGLRVGVVLEARAEQDPGGARRPGPWAYLIARNGAEYARRAAGLRGAIAVEARAYGGVLFYLARVLSRLVRRRPGGPREPWVLAVATARGATDFLLRRWGPPPPSLPGMGDVSNA